MRRLSAAAAAAAPLGRSLVRKRRIPSSSARHFSSAAQNTERQQIHEKKVALARAAKQERQRLHNEKSLLAQQAKEQRLRESEKNYRQAQERRLQHVHAQDQAQQRRVHAKRKNAIRSIPYWLGNDDTCFDLCMQALGIRTNQDKKAAEYKQLYLLSIPSFYQVLVEKMPLPHVLDKLAEAGFDDLQWAKQFRQRMDHQKELDRLDSRIESTQIQCDKKRAKLLSRKELLKRTMAEETEATKQTEPLKEDADVGLLDRALNVVTSVFRASTQEELLPEKSKNVPVQNQQKSFRVKRQEVDIQELGNQLTRLEQSLKRLQDERDSYKFNMTEQEHERANEVVKSVLGDICQELAQHIREHHSDTIKQYQALDSKTDLTKPHEWYPHARLDLRKIIFHAGPTNSGKTYQALERLKKANRGLYLGPLRLLAAEIYETLTSAGIYTNLFTGQEKREIPFATHSAATVEMAPTDEDFDVVVIDEIQMIREQYRGAAWTKALMGLRCKEIHVCGGIEAQSIVQKIADACGDELETITYERFGPLRVEEKSLAPTPKALGSYKSVQPGDCVVAFSRNDIFAIKREIEQGTDYKCCVIYGSLPPQTRTDQARRFNDPDSGYDILVASDAIGMGLNLNIRRIIFNSMYKFGGERIQLLDHSSVKQIAGRAGRRNSQFPDGLVTCRDPEDMDHLRKCMSTEIAPIQKAGLLPTAEHVELFNEALRAHELTDDYDNLHKILVQFSQMATLQGDFFLCRQTPMQIVAKMLNDVDLPLSDKYTLW